jgi:archaellum biogenesis protein FlaJ (TadC family)
MSQTDLHQLVIRLPVIGAISGAFVLIYGIWRKNDSALMAAYTVLIIAAIGAGVVYARGEGAEKTVEHLQGISKNVIEEHAEPAFTSLISLIVIGLIAMTGLFVTLKSSSLVRPVALLALTALLIGFGLIARAGYPGDRSGIQKLERMHHPARSGGTGLR